MWKNRRIATPPGFQAELTTIAAAQMRRSAAPQLSIELRKKTRDPAKESIRQGNFLIDAELVVFENVLGTQSLVTAIGQAPGRVLETIGVMATSPEVEVAHVGTQAGLVHDRDGFGIRMQRHFPVVGCDVGTVAVAIQQITVSLAIGPDASANSRRAFEHAHRVA